MGAATLLDLSMSFSIILGMARCSVHARSDAGCSLLLGDDLDLLSDGEAPLSSVDHDLEALEVSQVGTGLSLGQLLGEGSLGPLGSEASLLGVLGKGAGAAAASNINLHLGQ